MSAYKFEVYDQPRTWSRRRGPATLSFPADDPRHGTTNGYGNLGCRCNACSQANNDWHRDWKQRRRLRLAAEACHFGVWNHTGAFADCADSVCSPVREAAETPGAFLGLVR